MKIEWFWQLLTDRKKSSHAVIFHFGTNLTRRRHRMRIISQQPFRHVHIIRCIKKNDIAFPLSPSAAAQGNTRQHRFQEFTITTKSLNFFNGFRQHISSNRTTKTMKVGNAILSVP